MRSILRSNKLSQHFKQLDYFTTDYIEKLYQELIKMVSDPNGIHFHRSHNQICINTHKDFKTTKFKGVRDYMIGTGSLIFNWNDEFVYKNSALAGMGERVLTDYQEDERLFEKDFNIISSTFRDTIFEDLYNKLKQKHNIGRLRIMKMEPRKCLSWHKDTSQRLHIVLDTTEGNFMVIEDEIKHMPKNTCWKTNTRRRHTAFNSGTDQRIHIVGVILDD
jgi:hypothetical protein